MWESIVQIEEIGYSDAIDIEVSGNHLFYANDILTHNSNTDVELTDTSESFGLPATADFMFALISTEELEQLNQIMVKQLKNRYNDPTVHKRFMIGVDRTKMRLYDLEPSAQRNLVDTGIELDEEKLDNFNFNKHFKTKKDFSGFKL